MIECLFHDLGMNARLKNYLRVSHTLLEHLIQSTELNGFQLISIKQTSSFRHNPYQLENSIDRSRNLPLVKDDCTSLFLYLTYALEMQLNAHLAHSSDSR